MNKKGKHGSLWLQKAAASRFVSAMRWGLGKKGYISCQSNVYFKSEQPEILVTTQMYALLFVLLKKGLGVLSRGFLKTPGVAWCLVIFNTELILMSMLTLVI